jgi:hypothetical protein
MLLKRKTSAPGEGRLRCMGLFFCFGAERTGVEFIAGDATRGPGVRLTQSERTSPHKGVRSVQAIRLGKWRNCKTNPNRGHSYRWGLSPEKAETRRFSKESAVFHGIVQRRQTAGLRDRLPRA